MLINSLLQHTLGRIRDAFWPRYCISCMGEIRQEYGNVCELCSASLLPARDLPKTKYIERLSVCFLYDWRMRNLILHFKFHHGFFLAEFFAEKMLRSYDWDRLNSSENVLVPVPDHASRRRERGYNPAALVAERFSTLTGIEYSDSIVQRVRGGSHQSKLPIAKRKTSLSNTFACNTPVAGKNRLIILDDVTRTGTTLDRVAQSAKKAGWKKIEAICICG